MVFLAEHVTNLRPIVWCSFDFRFTW